MATRGTCNPAPATNSRERRLIDQQQRYYDPGKGDCQRAHDEAAVSAVDPSALVAELEKQHVRMPGYMKPIVFEERSVSEFLLVPYLPHHVKHHAHLEPNQMIYVVVAEPFEVENPLTPIWVSGTLHLKTVATDEGPVGYSISKAFISEYVY